MSDDGDLIMLLSTSSASLATAPGKKDNWIERAGANGEGGELPAYVRKLARAIMKSGKTKSQAIAIAISRCKRWAAGGGGVDADTKAKAAKAVAEWEKLKASNKSKKLVKASRNDGETYIMLSNVGDYSLKMVEQAWYAQQSKRLGTAEAASPYADIIREYEPYGYITEVWSNHLIVEYFEPGELPEAFKVPFTVDGENVHFGNASHVKQVWVETESLTRNEEELLKDLMGA